mgnify:CR=1 FL=1
MAIKKIKIDSTNQLTLNSSAGWLFEYQNQFGRDILPDLLPVVGAGVEFIAGIFEENGTVNQDILDSRKDEVIVQLAGMEVMTVIQITWAMAKNANDEIEPPREWLKQFETFPIDVILPVLFEMIAKSFVSSKNLNRLRKIKKEAKINLSRLTTSSSEQSQEDLTSEA